MFKCLKILKISIASLINDKEANRAVVFEITKGKGDKGDESQSSGHWSVQFL